MESTVIWVLHKIQSWHLWTSFMHLYVSVIGVALLVKMLMLFQQIELHWCMCLKQLLVKLWYFTLECECDKVQLQGAWRWITDAWRCLTVLFLSCFLVKYLEIMFIFPRVFGVPLEERGRRSGVGSKESVEMKTCFTLVHVLVLGSLLQKLGL